MSYVFSATKLAFYDEDLKEHYVTAGSWPSDAVELTDDELATYRTTPPSGQKLAADSDGKPTFVDIYDTDAAKLAAAQVAQSAALSAACAAAAVSGFTSDALGSTYTYPSAETDQLNLQARVLSSLLNASNSAWTTTFKCTDSAGTEAYVTHTAAQIQAVGMMGEQTINAYLIRKATLVAQVAAATTVAAVQAITWDSASS
ncbi:tail fiber assembly protein [Pseudomonas sp.]|jgi:hypothetical protein|uniref:DUF4376 domain-containing protein n=1 Tax=Pseudomonas sp. TaxID=306 RepID=UPI002ED89785